MKRPLHIAPWHLEGAAKFYISQSPNGLFLLLLRPLRVTEEESTATTMEALKARIRELERQILRGDRYKCLICMVSVCPRAVHLNRLLLGSASQHILLSSPVQLQSYCGLRWKGAEPAAPSVDKELG